VPASSPSIFRRLFIANRGEVAVRIAKACDELGIEPVFAVSTADVSATYVRDRETVCIGPPRAKDSYLDVSRVVQAARQSRCAALHPGWGFLSESSLLASLCEAHGITFIGPPASVLRRMGQKTPAKRTMAAAGLRVIPGSDGWLRDADQARAVAREVGYPVLIKAESGGGGRGMRLAQNEAEIQSAWDEASNEARAAFADPRVYLERWIESGRHIEIQIMADRYGNVVHFGERDCTIQRHHQKLIEESPALVLADDERERTLAAAVAAARSVGYVGAGTLEFLLDRDGLLRFMEMNTRLQVEHGVSEVRSGVDLVHEQIRVAAGHRLRWSQADISLRGHALECRINAEDPSDGFRPAPGKIQRFEIPKLAGLRVDTHIEAGYEVPPHYDSLLAKLITYGQTRSEAKDRMQAALAALVLEGVPTTVPMHQAILASPAFDQNRYDTGSLPGWPPPPPEP